VEVQEIAEGLWRWTAPHPEWTPDAEWERDVGCVYCDAPDAVCLIDPLVPRDEEERFWRALDRDVETSGKPVAVLLTVHWHRRSADEVAARYDAEQHGWGLARISREPPAGIEAIAIERADERVFWLAQHRALVVGDVLLGADGGLRVCPASWITREGDHPEEFLASLRGLLELPIERVLVSHGEPVLENGREALARALS
jgi:glyoxylase-like metal-dependent hydrolase (beta-lactamase superfamily II)